MENRIQEKMDSLSQAERILFRTFCGLINQTLYPEEIEGEKLKVEGLTGILESIASSIDRMNLLRVIDLVVDVATDLVCEKEPGNCDRIETGFQAAKAGYLSECLWQYDILGSTSDIAKKFFSDFERLLEAEVGK